MGPYLQYFNFLALNFKERFRKLNKKKLIIVLAVISLCVFIPKVVYGLPVIDVDDWAQETVFTILDAVFEATMTVLWTLLLIQIILALSNFFIGLAGALLSWAINLNISIPLTHCATAFSGCLVDSGWSMARDLANMFFILALVMIAFATILGIESYGMRRMLVPLILIALVINFSQVLIGAVVDFASVFMQIFAEQLIDWSTLITMSFRAQGQMLVDLAMGLVPSLLYIICPVCAVILGVSDPFTVLFTFFVKVLITIGINVLLGVLLLILAGLFLLRIPMMWVLTIIAPMGLVCYLFPFLRSKYKWWIDQVGQWAFIGVFALFFLWLGMSLWQMVWSPGWGTQWKTDTFGSGAALPGGLDRWLVDNILPGVVFMIFLFLALQFTQKTNAIFAAGIIGTGVALGRTMKGRMEKGVRGYVEPRAKAAARIPQMQRWAGAKLQRVPILGEVTKGWRERGEEFGNRIETEAKGFKEFTPEHVLSQISRPDIKKETRAGGILAILKKEESLKELEQKGKLGDFEKRLESARGDLEFGGKLKDVRNLAPRYAYSNLSPQERLEKFKDMVEKRTPSQLAEIQSEGLKDNLFLEALASRGTEGQFSRIWEDRRKREIVQDYINRHPGNFRTDLQEYFQRAKYRGKHMWNWPGGAPPTPPAAGPTPPAAAAGTQPPKPLSKKEKAKAALKIGLIGATTGPAGLYAYKKYLERKGEKRTPELKKPSKGPEIAKKKISETGEEKLKKRKEPEVGEP